MIKNTLQKPNWFVGITEVLNLTVVRSALKLTKIYYKYTTKPIIGSVLVVFIK